VVVLSQNTEILEMRALVPLIAVIAYLPSVFIYANEEPQKVETVTVSGIRQAYQGNFEIKEIPQAISVITARALAESNVLRFTDALDLNASVTRQNNFGGLWDSYAVRGFAGDENLPSGYLVNGFNGGRGFGGMRDVAGIERIEILKGPSAAMFGRGEPGGTVNIVTKQAIFGATQGNVSTSYGSFSRARFDADVNVPIGTSVAFRVNAFSEKSDSFRDTVDSERHGILPQIAVRFADNSQLRYDLELTRAKTDFDRGVLAINGKLDAIPRERFLGEPGDGPIKTDVTGHQLQYAKDFNEKWSLLLGASYRETEFNGFASFAELVGSRQRLLVDGRSLSRQRRLTSYDGKHQVIRGEVAGDFETGPFRHRVLIGVDYDVFENDQTLLRFRPGTASSQTPQSGHIIDVFSPVYGQFPLPAATSVVTDRLDRQKGIGFYIQEQVTLTDRLQVRLGARYDDFELNIKNRLANNVASRRDTRLSPQFGVVFSASSSVSLYSAIGSGFRSNIAITPSLSAVAPETSKSYEVGAKLSALGGALTGNVAAFNLEKKNVLAADLANPGFSLPIAGARSRGVELDLNGTLPNKWFAQFSYAYLDAEARADVADPNFSLQIRKGDPLINIPRNSLSAQLSKEFMVANTVVRAGAGVQHVGKRLGETATKFFLPSYTLVRFFATANVSKNVEVFGEVKNAFDETHYTSSFSNLWVRPGEPRTVSIGVRAKI
jgi:iron complex outermembrane recepter protein